MLETRTIPQWQQDTCERQNLSIEFNSCFSGFCSFPEFAGFSKSSAHLGKMPLFLSFLSSCQILDVVVQDRD